MLNKWINKNFRVHLNNILEIKIIVYNNRASRSKIFIMNYREWHNLIVNWMKKIEIKNNKLKEHVKRLLD